MGSDSEWGSSGDVSDDYESLATGPRVKRRKLARHSRGRKKRTDVRTETSEIPLRTLSFKPLLEALHEKTAKEWTDDSDTRDSYEAIIEPFIAEYEAAEKRFLQTKAATDDMSVLLQPISRQKARQIRESAVTQSYKTPLLTLSAAKSRLQNRWIRRLILERIPTYESNRTLTPLNPPRPVAPVNPQVLEALYAIQTTPYECSFLSRLQGFGARKQHRVIAVDWETRAPWMDLMSDIREHHALSHPEREQADEAEAPITYCNLQATHLPQVHDLLARVFWDGIDVSDALDYSPEKCTIVAMYKQLVVGAAFLSSPQETYITYLAVRAGWDNSQIATSMLYHLITLNPNKDITLHVSINNPAMLLYNRFGFKAEEFIVGFYEDYLDPNSPQSKNAFRLRLRR
ncbi:hypothetical protein FKP32DRAFT_1588181 [Trametes sanguinea]|nr:hypothetical protein FKP32DRAFT_1588181 [Trametes sanguinea]